MTSYIKKQILRRATEFTRAKKGVSGCPSFLHCCVILNSKKCVVSIASNTRDPREHAEVCASKRIKSGKGMTIISLRMNSNGNVLNAMPCSMCYSLIKRLGFSKIYYSDSNGNVVKATQSLGDLVEPSKYWKKVS